MNVLKWFASIIIAVCTVAIVIGMFYAAVAFFSWLPAEWFYILIFGGLILNIAASIKRDYFG